MPSPTHAMHIPVGGPVISCAWLEVCSHCHPTAMASIAFTLLFQSTQPRQHGVSVLWEPNRLDLMTDGTVSFGAGPMHGAWSNTCDSYSIRFHWQGNNDKAKNHVFQRIPGTDVYVLTQVDNVVRTDALVTPATSHSTGSSPPWKRGRSG